MSGAFRCTTTGGSSRCSSSKARRRGAPIVNELRAGERMPATTLESDAMSKALKKRGFRFVGSTICYAFMQATGMVNDHLVGCPSRLREPLASLAASSGKLSRA